MARRSARPLPLIPQRAIYRAMSGPSRLSDRAVIRLTGEDRISFLQGIVTQDIDRLKSEPAIFSALLTPQGKILFDFFIVNAGDALLIDCRRDEAALLLKRLSLYKLRAKVALEIDETLGVVVSDVTIPGGFADPRHSELGWRVITTETAPDVGAYHAKRIALGVPEFGADFEGDAVFLSDVNYDALNGVSYKKGCFIGQEVASRMKRKSEARRRTLIADFEGAAPEKGASVTVGDSTLGEILNAAEGKALAMIRLDRLEKAKATDMPVFSGETALHLRVPGYIEQG